MNKNKLVYLAMPYTHPDPVINTHNAMRVAEILIEHGCIPIIPHLSLFWHLVYPHPIEFWYDYDLKILERCDCLLRLGGESKGADKEVIYAKSKGIPVFTTLQDIWK